MSDIIKRIRGDLKNSVDEKTLNSFQRYFKEEVRAYGVKTAVVGKIAKKYWEEIKDKGKDKIFSLCEELFSSDIMEEAFVVSHWGCNFQNFVKASDMKIYREWIGKYINNWAKCDGFCNHAVGDLVTAYPDKVKELIKWTKSENRWVKRASAVSLIIPAKKGLFLEEAFQISSVLLTDKDDLVQKGYGWLLKEESRQHQKEIFEFVCSNKKQIPRTALRYAIELMPPDMRKEAMKK